MKFFRTLILISAFFVSVHSQGQSFVFKKKLNAFVFKPEGSSKIDKSITYFEVSDFKRGFCAVSDGKHWGVIDNNGNEVIPLMYNEIHVMWHRLFKVKVQSKYGVIDSKNKYKILPDHEELKSLTFRRGGDVVVVLKSGDYIHTYNRNSETFEMDDYNYEDFIYKIVEERPKYFENCTSYEGYSIHDCQRQKLQEWLNQSIDDWGVNAFDAVVEFVVTENGEIKQVQVHKVKDSKIIEKLSTLIQHIPVHEPGKQRGETVNVLISLPVNYGKQ